jgi:predicted acylesterase/phospholipase RssA
MFEDKADVIFGPRDFLDKATGGADEYFRANFSQGPLREVLTGMFGDKRLPDLENEVLVVSFDLASFKPKLFDRSDDYSLVDAALASSAAPTYLPLHVVHENLAGRATKRGVTRAFVDGGMVANNPAAVAISFALASGAEKDDVSLFSLGAGATPYKPPREILYEAKKVLDWGVRDWLVTNPGLLLKILFDGSVVKDHFTASHLLKNRYYRLQPVLSEDVDLGDAGKLPLLLNIAANLDLNEVEAWMHLEGWVA